MPVGPGRGVDNCTGQNEPVLIRFHSRACCYALLIVGSFFIVGEAISYLNVNNGLLFPTALE